MQQSSTAPLPVKMAVIMNAYNRLDLMKTALDTLMTALEQTAFGSAIVVLDAGSTDGSREYVRRLAEAEAKRNLHLVEAPGNTSFSAGCNLAVAEAEKRYPDLEYVFFYETDNFLRNPDALIAAVSLMDEKPNLGALGFTVQNHRGERVGHGERFPTYFSFLVGSVLYAKIAPGINRIRKWYNHGGLTWAPFDIVYTSPLLVRLTAWRQVGGMDSERFPFSDSDLDLGWKFNRAGYTSGVLRADGVLHDNMSQASAWSSKRTLDLHRARYTLLKKHRGAAVDFLRPLLFFRHLAEFALLSLSRTEKERVKASKATRIDLMKTVFRGYARQ